MFKPTEADRQWLQESLETDAYYDRQTQIVYLKGDAARPRERPALIAHVCNDIGAWGAGFSGSLGKAYPESVAQYRRWFQLGETQPCVLPTGWTQFVETGDVIIANMISQHGLRSSSNPRPLNYAALRNCLQQVYFRASGLSVHLPRIGCGLAGGRWEMVEPILNEELCRKGIQVYVYDL